MRDPGWVKFPVQYAWTQTFRYFNRRWETLSRRAVAWWEVETARSKAYQFEASQSTTSFSSPT